jgi:hypothetical protein
MNCTVLTRQDVLKEMTCRDGEVVQLFVYLYGGGETRISSHVGQR